LVSLIPIAGTILRGVIPAVRSFRMSLGHLQQSQLSMFSGLMGSVMSPYVLYPVNAGKKRRTIQYNSKAYETIIEGGFSGVSFGKNSFSILAFKQKLDLAWD
jgi:hypothetical protein